MISMYAFSSSSIISILEHLGFYGSYESFDIWLFFHTNYIEGHLVFSPLITRDPIMSIGSNSMNFKFKLLERVNVRE